MADDAPPPTYSRFQAIISARPGTNPILPPISNSQFPRYSNELWSIHPGVRKRKRDSSDIGQSSNIGKALQRAVENEAIATRETIQYQDRQHLIDALRTEFRQGPDVDFHGYYETIDPGVTHKQRIQTITHEIWKATGYRFTVKDHPQIKDGHKTRFWCSQDEAHRSKSSRMAPKPRVLSGGEVMAKTRYPCRSRLLISSRDTDKPGLRIITVRMHHHVAHEPYVDASLPPEVTQTIWESFGWVALSNAGGSSASGVNGASTPYVEEPEESPDGSDEEPEDYDGERDSLPVLNGHVEGNYGLAPPSLIPADEPPVDPEKYQKRMQAHISNIRDFCDGLEYQLQFNDYRMLGVLEREGGSFLRLVEDCLKKEGRLSSIDGSDRAIAGALDGHTGDDAVVSPGPGGHSGVLDVARSHCG